MIINYINYISRLEKEHGKMASVFGIILPLVVLLIGLAITMFGLHIVCEASKHLIDAINDLFY